VLVTLLSVILTPVGNTFATPAQHGNQAHLAQDATEPPEQKSPNDPPQGGKPTEAPIETKEPPATKPVSTDPPTTEEAKPTEPVETEPVQTEPPATDLPTTEPTPTEQPATEPPTELAASEPAGPGIRTITRTLIVIKGLCSDPAFNPYSATSSDLAANCAQSTGDATFTYREVATGFPESEVTVTQTTIGSTTTFILNSGNYDLQETIPAGFGQPVVSCYIDLFDADILMPVYTDTIRYHSDPGATTTCHWYNVAVSPTTITVIKGLCDVPGFDPYTASPDELAANCTRSSGDATFTYHQTNTGEPNELILTQTTIGSTTTFDVPPGGFTIQETVPIGFGAPVVSCYIDIFNIDLLLPVDIDTIASHIDLGATFTCHWYNVTLAPAGSLTVIKYTCGPSTWWSFAPCPIHRKGQDFDLLQWIDGAWVSYGIGTTDRSGRHTWTNLPPGKYALDEIGRDWCRITSDNMTPGETAISVEPGQETIVQVYNCASTRPTSPPVRVIDLLALLIRDIWNPAP
jgi:hypothetical protein